MNTRAVLLLLILALRPVAPIPGTDRAAAPDLDTRPVAGAAGRGGRQARPKEIATTIRNTTRFPIPVVLKPHRSPEPAERRTLAPGTVTRIEGRSDLDITFPRGGGRITIRIEAGQDYAFRPDPEGRLQLYLGSHGREDVVDLAPYVQTPMAVVDRMLELAGIDGKDVIYDLGCGDGRIVIRAAERFGARGVGIDIVPERISEARAAAVAAFVDDRVEFRRENALESDFSGATVVFMYLIPQSNALLRPVLEERLAPGTRVISHAYPIPGWEEKLISVAPVRIGLDETHYLYIYRR